MENKEKLAAPCCLYCGICGVYIAHRDNNIKFKERLATVYGVSVDHVKCEGCLSDELFVYCKTCPIRSCTIEGRYTIEGGQHRGNGSHLCPVRLRGKGVATAAPYNILSRCAAVVWAGSSGSVAAKGDLGCQCYDGL